MIKNYTRNSGLKLLPKSFNTLVWGDFMTWRICDVWNRILPGVIASGSVDNFKPRIDIILPDLDL